MEKPKDTTEATICVFNGPNLNLLGTREPHNYGHASLADVEKLCADNAAQFGQQADCRRSNRDGELVDFVHEADARKAFGVAINTGAYSHASIARHDALRAVGGPPRPRGAHQQHLRTRRLAGSCLHCDGSLCRPCRLRH
jgi:3-dehydroquinate dehydratase-2